MAKITIEDCLSNVESHFDLTIIASKRARQIVNGAQVDYDGENIVKSDKPEIIALREIAHECIDVNKIKQDIIQGYRKVSYIENDNDFEEEDITFDSFDDPDMIESLDKENIAEEIKEDVLTIKDEISEEMEEISEEEIQEDK